jgi:hypothetical protein
MSLDTLNHSLVLLLLATTRKTTQSLTPGPPGTTYYYRPTAQTKSQQPIQSQLCYPMANTYRAHMKPNYCSKIYQVEPYAHTCFPSSKDRLYYQLESSATLDARQTSQPHPSKYYTKERSYWKGHAHHLDYGRPQCQPPIHQLGRPTEPTQTH